MRKQDLREERGNALGADVLGEVLLRCGRLKPRLMWSLAHFIVVVCEDCICNL